MKLRYSTFKRAKLIIGDIGKPSRIKSFKSGKSNFSLNLKSLLLIKENINIMLKPIKNKPSKIYPRSKNLVV